MAIALSPAAPKTTRPPAHGPAGTSHLMPDFSRLTGAPEWFQDRARAAWEEFQTLPLPGAKDEAWRYSSAKRIALDALRPAAPPTEAEKGEAIARSTGLSATAAKLVFVNDVLIHAEGINIEKERECGEGPLAQSSSSAESRKNGEWSATHSRSFSSKGLACLPFSEALTTHGDLLERHLMKRPAQLGSEKFAALHLAHVRAGVVVLAPQDLALEHPVEIFHWTVGEGALVFPHTLVVTGDRARVTVVDHHLSLRDEAAASIAVADFVAGPGSRITYVNDQDLSPGSRALHISSTTVAREATVKALQLHLGASFSRSESVSDLVGEGGRSDMLGVGLPSGTQHVDMRTLQNHLAPRTSSDLLYKNALYDRSRTVFAGLIQVAPGAHFTDAYQKCRNLLNSDEAEAASLPGLEINADQVRCSHGATSAPISAEELFYLKSRGIPDGESRRLIATGFLEDVIARIDDPALVAELDRRIEAKLARTA